MYLENLWEAIYLQILSEKFFTNKDPCKRFLTIDDNLDFVSMGAVHVFVLLIFPPGINLKNC